jgi:hypothetical protein
MTRWLITVGFLLLVRALCCGEGYDEKVQEREARSKPKRKETKRRKRVGIKLRFREVYIVGQVQS